MGNTEEDSQLVKLKTTESGNESCRNIQKADQCFLMYFIMGVYFGPDLREGGPPKSALQRIIEGVPPYSSDQLGGSRMRIEELEQIYCFLVRKSDKSIAIDFPLFHEFLRGNLPKKNGEETSAYLQFPDLFPAQLHSYSETPDGSIIIENVVYIDNPETTYLKPDDVERFKRVIGQEVVCIPGSTMKLQNSLSGGEVDAQTTNDSQLDADLQKSPKDIRCYKRKRRLEGARSETEEATIGTPAGKDGLSNGSNGTTDTNRLALTPYGGNVKPELPEGPAMVVLPSQPSAEELNGIVARSKHGYALTGNAVKGQVGPVIGLMDIGEAEDSYLFRVALPGVKKEGRAFRCEVESDGKVLIKGETVTGEQTVHRFTQAFEMQTRNLCPPGPFSISFRLPGPVDHRQFMGSFGPDGILEGIVMKAGKSTPSG